MFKNIIIPLDGSQLAEAVLPVVSSLARTFGARVTLLHIIEHNAPDEVHGEHHLTNEEEALAYLDEVAKRAFPDEIQVESHVHANEENDVARSIVDHAVELGTDLIAMCTHGRSGLRTWLYGSIAQQVLSLGKTPVLLVQPGKTEMASKFSCQRLLVPLDGNPDHEQGLKVAIRLAQVCKAALHLVMVVHTFRTLPAEQAATATLLPGATSEMLDLNEQGAAEYLRRLNSDIEAVSIVATSEVQRGDPAKAISDAAHRESTDLIVIATHGKTGMDAFWSGSVTPKISSRSRTPLLLVPVHIAETLRNS